MPLGRGRPPHHYGEQNGDLMRGPDMVFEIHAWVDAPAAEPLTFRNEYMGLLQEVYRYGPDGKKTHVNTKPKQEFKSFAKSPPRRMDTRVVPSTRKSWMEYFDLRQTPDSRCLGVRK
jgi:hypothetical protein